MAQIRLQRPGVVPPHSPRRSRRHGAAFERGPSGPALRPCSALYHPTEPRSIEWSPAFGDKDKGAWLSRRCWRRARSSRPVRGCVEGDPFLILRTWSTAPLKSICSHGRSTTSPARNPCRNARRIISPSRWPHRLRFAVSIRYSTSTSVRCSRVRSAALGRRSGTVRISVVGDCARAVGFPVLPSPIGPDWGDTVRLLVVL